MRGNTGLLHCFPPEVSQYCASIPQHDDSIDQYILPRTTVFHQYPLIYYLALNLDRSNTGLVLKVEGQIVEIEIEACLEKISNEENMDFEKDPDIINGLNDFKVDLRTHLNINDAKFVRLISSEDSSEAQIELNNFKPGSVVAIRFTLQKTQHDACVGIQKLLW